jgi:hypothetical protein
MVVEMVRSRSVAVRRTRPSAASRSKCPSAGIVVFWGTTLSTRSTALASVVWGVRNFMDPLPPGEVPAPVVSSVAAFDMFDSLEVSLDASGVIPGHSYLFFLSSSRA